MAETSFENETVFMEELKNNNGSLSLDFANPVHYNYVLNLFGGKELLQSKFPTVNEVLEESKNMALEKKENTFNEKEEPIDDFADTYGIDFVSYGNLSSNNSEVVTTRAHINLKKKQDLEIFGRTYDLSDPNNKKVINAYNYFEDNCGYLCKYSKINLKKAAVKDKIFEETASFTWTALNGSKLIMNGAAVSKKYIKVLGGNSIVKEIIVDDPMPKESKGEKTVVLYKREPAVDSHGNVEKFDYKYPNNAKTGDLVEVCLPLKGKIFFYEEYEIKYVDLNDDFLLCIDIPNHGSANYDVAKLVPKVNEVFTIDNTAHTLSWDFSKVNVNDDWGIKAHAENLPVGTDVDLTFNLAINVKRKKDSANNILAGNAMIVVTSNPEGVIDDPAVKEIPKINIRWGCIAKGTKIIIGDGSEKNIENLKVGDVVLSGEKEKLKIKNIITGPERYVICIETCGNKKIYVTSSHPIITEKGMKAAKDLYGDDSVKTVSGFEKIKYCYMIDYNDTVYNLVFDKESTIIGNGFIVGDFDTQNKLENKEQEISEIPTEKQLKFREELRQLNKYLQERRTVS